MYNRVTVPLFILTSLSFSCAVTAASINGQQRSGSNSFLFIENNIDNEHFITPTSLEPRFSGSNVWTKYDTNQDSLGYMGYGTSRVNRYADLWISNSPIETPFQGIRCQISGRSCPSTSFIAADVVDKSGIYHARTGSSTANGSSPYGLFSSSAYNFFREQAVGDSTTFVINWCVLRLTNRDYDYRSGVRCRDLPVGDVYWETYTLTSHKIGHLSLINTGAISDLWIASDGTPSIADGSSDEWCRIGVVNNVNGAICKVLAYDFRHTQSISSINVEIIIDRAQLGFTPANTDVRFSGDGINWYNQNRTASFDDMFTPGSQYVYVFMSQAFFRKMTQSSGGLTGKNALFTFSFRNRNTPQSGFYQITASNRVNIVPKEYGISIISSDRLDLPQRSGIIGSDSPITFEYQITTSAARQADSITAQVIGDSVTLGNVPWCLFTSVDNSQSVPIQAYLSFVSKSGGVVRQRNSCSEGPVDMTNADWVATPWDASLDSGYFYKTRLNLLFPMNDSRSRFTVSGEEWFGTVSASGEVKVTATWLGVN